MNEIGIAIIGCGGITLQNHLPGLALCPETRVVALCDNDPAVLERARQQCQAAFTSDDYRKVVDRSDVQAVIIATPNVLHAPIALAAVAAGKHVFCEKPLAMNFAEALEMYRAAEGAGVRHMTAFTYRFVPAMRYLTHLVKSGAIGRPYHFRSCRLQDWGTRSLGWRQVAKLAGSGELGDMLSHRIDYAQMLIGPIEQVVADTRLFHGQRDGLISDLEDWVGILARFESTSTTGILESSKLATGRGEGAHSQDFVELNGEEGSVVFQLEDPLQLRLAKRGGRQLETIPVPKEFLKVPGSRRDPAKGDPLFSFRYDQTHIFIEAITNQQACEPSFRDGARAQAVMEAAIKSVEEGGWTAVAKV